MFLAESDKGSRFRPDARRVPFHLTDKYTVACSILGSFFGLLPIAISLARLQDLRIDLITQEPCL